MTCEFYLLTSKIISQNQNLQFLYLVQLYIIGKKGVCSNIKGSRQLNCINGFQKGITPSQFAGGLCNILGDLPHGQMLSMLQKFGEFPGEFFVSALYWFRQDLGEGRDRGISGKIARLKSVDDFFGEGTELRMSFYEVDDRLCR